MQEKNLPNDGRKITGKTLREICKNPKQTAGDMEKSLVVSGIKSALHHIHKYYNDCFNIIFKSFFGHFVTLVTRRNICKNKLL